MKKIIQKYVLKNALDFGGKANPKAVLGPVLKEDPGLKSKVPEVLKEIETAVKEMDKLSLDQIKQQLHKIAPELLNEKKEEVIAGPLKPLPHAQKGKVVVRIAPSPSGPLHIGHAYGVSLNYEYAKMYGGKFIVRIEDTNAENIYIPAYEMIEEDTRWLTDKGVNKVVIQSERLGIYYDYAEKLVQMGQAYVCTCDAEQWKEMKNKSKACPCRNLSVKENALRYAKMFNDFAEGEAVLRLKTDIKNKNPAMRDFAIMRIVEHLHPKTGKEHRVWPLMILSVAVDDHALGITHVLNGKDHADNGAKERLIMEYLGWKVPEYKHWGMINFEGFELSTTKTKQAIAEGQYSGWDDIRLPFIPALRKRGYQAGAFRKFAVEIGLSLNDKTVTMEEFWKSIDSFNKDLIDSRANRYFFVDNPVKIKIEKTPKLKLELDLHPNHPQRGKREFSINEEFYIAEGDFNQLEEGLVHRLMGGINFIKKGKKFEFVSENYEDFKKSPYKGQIVHWLPANKNVKVEVLLNDGTIVKGLGEDNLHQLKEGDIIQLERRYFARLNNMAKDKFTFWYLHK